MILRLVATTLIALAFAVSITRGHSLYDAEALLVTFHDVGDWVAGSLTPQHGQQH